MLTIRLSRVGRKKVPRYRLIVQESRYAPTGKVVARVGHFNPQTKEATFDKEAIQKYLDNGAQPSNTVAKLLKKEGLKLPSWVQIKERNRAPKTKSGGEETAEPKAKPESKSEDKEAAKDQEDAAVKDEDKAAQPAAAKAKSEKSDTKDEPKQKNQQPSAEDKSDTKKTEAKAAKPSKKEDSQPEKSAPPKSNDKK